MAYGRPGGSYWRWTFLVDVMRDGSSTRYFCPDCRQETQNLSEGMTVWGVKLERVQRFGPATWPIQPALGIHAGVGRVSGHATKYVRSLNAGTMTVQRVGARELFGSDFLLNAGIDAGIAGEFSDNWTYGVSAGYDHPGLSAGVKVTYWMN